MKIKSCVRWATLSASLPLGRWKATLLLAILYGVSVQHALANYNFTGPVVVTAAPALNAGAQGALAVAGGPGAVNTVNGFAYTGITLTYTTPKNGEVATITFTLQRPVTFVEPLNNNTITSNLTVNETIPFVPAGISTNFTYNSSLLVSAPAGATAKVAAFPPGGNGLNNSAQANFAEKAGADTLQGTGSITIASPLGDPGGTVVTIVLPNSADSSLGGDLNSPTLPQWSAIVMALGLITLSIWQIRRGRPSGYTGTA